MFFSHGVRALCSFSRDGDADGDGDAGREVLRWTGGDDNVHHGRRRRRGWRWVTGQDEARSVRRVRDGPADGCVLRRLGGAGPKSAGRLTLRLRLRLRLRGDECLDLGRRGSRSASRSWCVCFYRIYRPSSTYANRSAAPVRAVPVGVEEQWDVVVLLDLIRLDLEVDGHLWVEPGDPVRGGGAPEVLLALEGYDVHAGL